MYIKDDFKEIDKFKHVFHKGSPNGNSKQDGTYGPLNAPGVYLYRGAKSITHLNDTIDANTQQRNNEHQIIGMLVRLNIHNDNEKEYVGYKYYDNIYVDNLPSKYISSNLESILNVKLFHFCIGIFDILYLDITKSVEVVHLLSLLHKT